MSNRLQSISIVVLLFAVALPFAAADEKTAVEKATDKPSAKEAAKAKKKVTLAAFMVEGVFPETNSQIGFFGEMEQTLRDTIHRIEKASRDRKISGIVLRLRNPAIGRGKIDELRTAIKRARKAGTKVYADLHTATSGDYLIACACDEIIMPPSGSLMIPGVRAEVMFYQGLFKKIGIEADFIQMGKYKGAAEPYTRAKMSKAFREEYEAIIDDYYNQMVESIAESRKLKPAKVRELIDEGMFSATRAKELGLIDRIAYDDEFKKSLRDKMEATELNVVKGYGKKEVDTDFSGFGGFMKLMALMTGADTQRMGAGGDKIAIVYAVGPIMSGESQQMLFGGQVLGADTIVKALRQADQDKNVKAIVLRVDSPGGSALASDLIWRETVKIKKPIVASMGDVAASGGYYISMAADKIFAEPGTLTGSIGVVGGKLALGGTFNKLGLTTDIVFRGKNSGAFSTTQKFSDAERKVMTELMKDVYQQFTAKAAEGRKMELAKLEELAQGRVYTGRMAKKNGLVDELGTLDDAIAAAKKLAGIGARKKVNFLILPKPKSFFEQMLGGPSIETRIGRQIAEAAPELTGAIEHAQLLRRLFNERAVTILPFGVKIK